ncbi:hypothetical protein [Pseudorhodobacter sp.]|uniref:hypothetical protein n=1 Tax=Pseudorhodobacter sp. TaxID=1934400 RepID=UPI002648CC03|nr:hypothetical protein [Pseudorhodobacter sp.]MDN5787504.1 hypothetical protein [Pseudorhodobacter sp.]
MKDQHQNNNSATNTRTERQKTGAEIREARLKLALKANMARRKAQAKARRGQNSEKSQGQ